MKYGSVCSGIEAATVAWHKIGLAPAWFSEIEPFPCSVLAHHYPHVPNLGDMTKIKNRVLNQSVVAPDVLVGGTPCQSFSVAGLREGLDESRGQLTLEFVRLANAIDFIRARKGQPPSIIVWENVHGVLSSKDNAFGCFLAGLAGEDNELHPSGKKWTNSGCVFGPERTIAWRTLDAQYFGLAQRRKRVFVIASARKDIDCTKILFERDSVRRDTPPCRQSQQDLAATIEASLGRSRGAGTPIGGLISSKQWPTDITATLNAAFGSKLGLENQHIDGGASLFVPAIITLTSKQQSLNTGNDIALTVCANDYKEPQVVCFHPTQDPISSVDGLSHSLGCGSSNGQASVAVAYSFDSLASNSMKSANPHSGCRQVDLSKTIDTATPCPSKNQGGLALVQSVTYGIPANWIGRKPENGGNATEPPIELSPCLTKTDVHAVQTQMQVRRLTPRECERLQGFPDDYTLIPHKGKSAADSPRYKALGNSMAVPVMAWIGERIQQAVKA